MFLHARKPEAFSELSRIDLIGFLGGKIYPTEIEGSDRARSKGAPGMRCSLGLLETPTCSESKGRGRTGEFVRDNPASLDSPRPELHKQP